MDRFPAETKFLRTFLLMVTVLAVAATPALSQEAVFQSPNGAIFQNQVGTVVNFETTAVSFPTEDGWTIHGTYYLPETAAQAPVPALIVLSEPGGPGIGDHTAQIGGNISRAVAGRIGMAALNIDVRGSGHSFGKKYFQEFSPEERDGVQLDIRGAIKYLSSQPGIDPDRIAILAPSVTAEYAVREAAQNIPQVQGLVLITGEFSQESLEYIELRSDLPVLAIASKDDPGKVQLGSTKPYYYSKHPGSGILFVIDRGAAIFNRPGQIMEQVSDWLQRNVGNLGRKTEISFKTEDGWTLHGSLFTPDNLGGRKVPGVVFVHGQNHDVQTWYYLAREVAKSGKAVLVFDRRANGKSIWQNGPTPPGSTGGNPLDVKAAINFMTSQSAVDGNRIALVGATAIATALITASMNDARIKTMVGLSLYGADDASKQYIAKSEVPLFLLVSTRDVNADGGSLTEGSRELHRLSKSKGSELIVFDNAGRGSNLQQVKPEINAMIVRWLNEKLGM